MGNLEEGSCAVLADKVPVPDVRSRGIRGPGPRGNRCTTGMVLAGANFGENGELVKPDADERDAYERWSGTWRCRHRRRWRAAHTRGRHIKPFRRSNLEPITPTGVSNDAVTLA